MLLVSIFICGIKIASVMGKAIDNICLLFTSTFKLFIDKALSIKRQIYLILPAKMNYLKTAFKIQPMDNTASGCHLLIEAGWEGISFVYYSIDPLKVEGLYIYHFEKNSTALQIADELSLFFKEENLPEYLSCIISYNFKECTLLPSSLYNEALLPQMLNILYADNAEVNNYAEKINAQDAHMLYRVNHHIDSVIRKEFPGAQVHHSNFFQLPVLSQHIDSMYCIIYQNSMKVVLFKEGVLQIVQIFEYTTPSDVAYQLLNICNQHDLSSRQITITVSGFIDKKSNLFDELYRYFLNIDLDKPDNGVAIATHISQYPVHFFSHLILLVKCVS
jgi:Protein of unknown function (DUF3822)